MNTEQLAALQVVLEFVERWNKNDENQDAAEAAVVLQKFYDTEIEKPEPYDE